MNCYFAVHRPGGTSADEHYVLPFACIWGCFHDDDFCSASGSFPRSSATRQGGGWVWRDVDGTCSFSRGISRGENVWSVIIKYIIEYQFYRISFPVTTSYLYVSLRLWTTHHSATQVRLMYRFRAAPSLFYWGHRVSCWPLFGEQRSSLRSLLSQCLSSTASWGSSALSSTVFR